MANWIDIGAADQYPENTKDCIEIEGKPLVICNIAGQIAVIANVCPHAGLPLGEGELTGKVLTCPFHGYAYDVTTGRNLDFPNEEPPAPTFPVEIKADRILVDFDRGQ